APTHRRSKWACNPNAANSRCDPKTVLQAMAVCVCQPLLSGLRYFTAWLRQFMNLINHLIMSPQSAFSRSLTLCHRFASPGVGDKAKQSMLHMLEIDLVPSESINARLPIDNQMMPLLIFSATLNLDWHGRY